MSTAEDLRRVLWDALEALGPYRDELVLVGGWVPYLYHLHYGPGGEPPLQTFDVDLVAAGLGRRGDRPRIAELLAARGFREELLPTFDDRLPKVRFVREFPDGSVSYVGRAELASEICRSLGTQVTTAEGAATRSVARVAGARYRLERAQLLRRIAARFREMLGVLGCE